MAIRRLLMGLLISSSYAAAQNPPPSLTTIYSFTSGTDGGNPDVPLIIGEGGVLYGATYWGGNKNYGAVFSLTAPVSPGGTWAEAVLYSFQGGNDGFNPDTRLAMGSGGVLYGTTNGGGEYNYGTAFSLTPPASPGGPWTKAEIYPFFVADGTYPDDMVISPAGVLYGNTLSGGDYGCCGTVFAIEPPASPGGRWIERVLYTFPTGIPAAEGNEPHVSIGKNLV